MSIQPKDSSKFTSTIYWLSLKIRCLSNVSSFPNFHRSPNYTLIVVMYNFAIKTILVLLQPALSARKLVFLERSFVAKILVSIK